LLEKKAAGHEPLGQNIPEAVQVLQVLMVAVVAEP
jgi:hypothetical protein